MRHADKPTVEVEVRVAAAPEVVWPLVADVALPAQASPELVEAHWVEPTAEPAVGCRFVGTNRNRHFGQWQTISTVTEYDPPHTFGWAVGEVDDPNTSWRFTLRRDGEDGQHTVLTQWMQLGTGASGLGIAIARMPDLEERIVQRRLEEFQAAMRANLELIRQRAEQRDD